MKLAVVFGMQMPSVTTLVVYDLETQQEVARTDAFLAYTIAYNREGDWLIETGIRHPQQRGEKKLKLIRVLDSDTLKPRYRLQLPHEDAWRAHLLNDNKTLITWGPGTIASHDLATGKTTARVAGPKGHCKTVLSPDGKLLAILDVDALDLRVHDTATGKEVVAIDPYPKLKDMLPSMLNFAFSSDSKIIVLQEDSEYEVVVVNATTGKELSRTPSPRGAYPRAIGYAPDKKSVILAGWARNAGFGLFDPKSQNLIHAVEPGATFLPSVAAISRDGSRVALGWNDEVRLWDVKMK